jgi:hypothetical protein
MPRKSVSDFAREALTVVHAEDTLRIHFRRINFKYHLNLNYLKVELSMSLSEASI